MDRKEHPQVAAAKVTARTAVVVALISAVSGGAIAWVSLLKAGSAEAASATPVSLQSDLDTISNQKTQISALEARLNCVMLEVKPLIPEISDWKRYMQLTAETTVNQTERHTRTEAWFGEVDDAIGVLEKVIHYAAGNRRAC